MTPELTVSVGDTPDAVAEPGTEIAYTGDGEDAGFQAAANDVGSGIVTLRNDNALLASLDQGKYLRWMLDGTQRYCTRVSRKRKKEIAPDEEVAHLTVVESRGLLADWEDATVQPELGFMQNPYSTARVFGFASPYYDDSAWDPPYEQFRQDDFDVPPNRLFAWPTDWPDPFIYWIWPTEKVEDEEVDAGVAFFRATVNLSTGGLYRLCMDGDNRFRGYVDGIEVLAYNDEHATQGWDHTYDVDVPLTGGSHVVAAVVENIAGPVNNAGFLCGLWENAGSDGLGAKVLESDDTDWLCVLDPDPIPGFTIGHVLRILREEVQALTDPRLDGWTDSFSDTLDSDGNAWPLLPEIVVQVGDDLLKVLHQFAEAYIDFDCDADAKVLNAWVKGERGTTTAVAFDPGSNVTELARDEVGVIKNVVHVRYREGHTELVSAEVRDAETSIERYGVREVFLSLDDFETLDSVTEYLTEWLTLNAWPRLSIVFGLHPSTGAVPFADFGVADLVDVDGETVQIVGMTAQADDLGLTVFTAEVATRGEILAQNLERALQTKANGTHTGRSLFASPSRPGVSGVSERKRPQAQRLSPYSWAGEVIVDTSGKPAIDGPIRLTGLILSGHGDGTGDTTVHLNLNGTSVGSVTLGSADTELRESFIEDLTAGDVLEAECTEAGGQTGIVATPRAYYV